ncbi:putative zinc protease [bacterium HR21]|nr:putative zinc protease [bacterium HR21]
MVGSLVESRLSNGLCLVILPRPQTPVVAIVVLYRVGSQDELPEQAGLAHLVEHLAFGTTAELAREEFDRYCTDAGGTNNAMTTYSYTLYYMVLPAYQVELGLWLEASRMRGLRFSDEEFATQQRVILEELKETVYNQPYGRWRDVQAAHAFAPGCPYHWEVHGSLESVAALRPEQARAFVQQYYRPDNAVVVVCGGVDPLSVRELAEQLFGEIPRGNSGCPRHTFRPECRRGKVRVSVPDRVPVAAVFLSFHSGGYTAPEFLELQALADILGHGRSSRLYRELVLRRGQASQVGAFLDARQWASLLTCYAFAASPEAQAEALWEALWDELRQLQREGIRQDEWQTACNRLRTAYVELLQHPLGIAQEVAFSTVFWGDPERPFRVVEEYAQLRTDQLQERARQLFCPEHSVATLVVPDSAG